MEVNYIAIYGGTYFVPLFIPPLLLFNILFVAYIARNLTVLRVHTEESPRDWVVWLSLLPIFNLIWLLIVVKHVDARIGPEQGISDPTLRSVSRDGYLLATFNFAAYVVPIAGAVALAPVALIFQIRYWLGLRRVFAECRRSESHVVAESS